MKTPAASPKLSFYSQMRIDRLHAIYAYIKANNGIPLTDLRSHITYTYGLNYKTAAENIHALALAKKILLQADKVYVQEAEA